MHTDTVATSPFHGSANPDICAVAFRFAIPPTPHRSRRGQIVGVDVSPHMIARARLRVERNGLTNVLLVEGLADILPLKAAAVDATLCFYAHDVVTSENAISCQVAVACRGGRIVAAGQGALRVARRWPKIRRPLRTFWPFAVHLMDSERPYRILEQAVRPLQSIERHVGGTAYLVRTDVGSEYRSAHP